MSSEVRWHPTGRIIVIKNFDILTVDDVIGQATQITEMMNAAAQPVHIIDDLSRINGIDPKLTLLPFKMPNIMKFAQHPNLDIIALVGMTNPLAAFAFEVVTKLHKNLTSQYFATVEQAAEWLLEVDRIRQRVAVV
jgi:hypothetical protein